MVQADVFSALANPTRRDLLTLLQEGPQSVSDLASHFDMRRPSVSEHLRVLRRAELVREQRRGRHRIYELDPVPLREVAAWLQPFDEFWRTKLKSLDAFLDDEAHG